MGFTFILAEKQEAAKRIAYALDDNHSAKLLMKGEVPYFEATNNGKTLRIISAVGHLYTIAPKKRGYAYPVFDVHWVAAHSFNRRLAYTKKWIDAIAKVSRGASECVSATDYDVEGELIGYTTLRFACKEKEREAKRMVFSTLTDVELQRAFSDLQMHLDNRLAEAGEARHIVDFLWGINVSRALTSALRRSGHRSISLSAGRVQGPALGFVIKRDESIEHFLSTPYLVIHATIEHDGYLYTAEYSRAHVTTFDEAQRIVARCKTSEALVKRISTKAFQQTAPPAFSLGTLQSEAYRIFHYTPSKTLQVAESLYLNALISYPRTGSEKIPPTIDCKQILSSLANSPAYSISAKQILEGQPINPTQGKGDDPAHPAIHPTGNLPDKTQSGQEARLYDLVVKRFLSTFAQSASWESTSISLDLNDETFVLRGKRLLGEGWLEYYKPYSREDETSLPFLKKGQSIPVRKVDHKEMHTEPPPRYNPSSLLREMEVEELGTKATRAAIIDILFKRGYVTGEKVTATSLGRGIFETLKRYCPNLVSVELTRRLEQGMEAIHQGKASKEQVITEASDTLERILKDFKQNEEAISKSLATAFRKADEDMRRLGQCPVCGKGDLLIIRSSRTGKVFAGCSGFAQGDCSASFPLPQLPHAVSPSRVRCSSCGWPTIVVSLRRKRRWKLCLNPECPTKAGKERKQQAQTSILSDADNEAA